MLVTITLDGVGIGCTKVDCENAETPEKTRAVKLSKTDFFILLIAMERRYGEHVSRSTNGRQIIDSNKQQAVVNHFRKIYCIYK